MDHSVEQVGDPNAGASREDARLREPGVEKTKARQRVRERKPSRPKHPSNGAEQPPEKDAGGTKRSFFRRPIVLIGAASLVLLAIIAGVLWWLDSRNYETTDDAFLDAHIVRVASQIAGEIMRVDVDDNQQVQPGQVLVEVNPADARSRLAQAIAQEAQAETVSGQARAQINGAEANYQQALATAAGARAQAQNAERELARYRALVAINPQAAAQSQVDQAETQARNTAAQASAAAKQADAVAAQRAAAAAQLKGAQSQIEALKAQVAEARINLGYTHIVAAIEGHIAQRTAAIGTYVAPGQQMMAIVPLQIWVTANFKETQLPYMRAGQVADIHVDACPNVKVRGHVDSIQRGAGQAFALLPPENATGNFVKVVQRVPVKIVLDTVPRECPLGPGMSVEPTVKVR
jgi:membrane fusion protein (multidrug efflux system)